LTEDQDYNDPAPETEEVPDVEEETNETPEGNEPEEEGQEESQETEEKSVEGGSEDTSPKESEEKSEDTEESAEESPKTIKLGEEEVAEEELLQAWKAKGEVASAKKEAENLYNQAKFIIQEIPKNPKGVMIDIFTGILGDKKKARAAWLEICEKETIENFERQSMPEGDRKALELQEELEEQRKLNEENLRRQQHSQRTVEEARARERILGEISGAIEKVKLPNNARNLRMISEVLLNTRMEGHDVSALEAAKLVQKELEKEEEEHWKGADLEKVKKHRPDLVEQLREADIQEIKGNRQAKTAKGKAEPKKRDSNKPRVVSSAEAAQIFGY